MTAQELHSARRELAKYSGIPKCPDCGWKWSSDIAMNCNCRGENSPESAERFRVAFARARELQAMLGGMLR